MSLLRHIPLWGYFVILGAAFLTGHLLAYHPDPAMRRGRRLAGRWGSSLLLLVGLLLVSNRHVGTVLPALLLALLGGIVSGRTAPPQRAAPPAEDGGGRPGDGGGQEPAGTGREAERDGPPGAEG